MIRFVTALRAEAEPLVERFGMTPERGSFRWFRSEDAALVVSGVGKHAAASAVGYLHARTGEAEDAAWIDAGIAGHRDRALGDVLLAHTVRDEGSGATWHPVWLGGAALPRVEVRTVDAPESRFDADAAYDMEASGFYPAALRLSSVELVQVVKVVSDHREAPWTGLRPRNVRAFMEGNLEAIALLTSHLRALSHELLRTRTPSPELEAYAERFRMTVSQRRKLARLLARWRTLAPEAERGVEAFSNLSSARDVLDRVEQRVRAAARERPL